VPQGGTSFSFNNSASNISRLDSIIIGFGLLSFLDDLPPFPFQCKKETLNNAPEDNTP
jgi:hypothetical protein